MKIDSSECFRDSLKVSKSEERSILVRSVVPKERAEQYAKDAEIHRIQRGESILVACSKRRTTDSIEK